MKNFATADCETDPFKFGRIPKPFIWGFYSEEGFEYFRDKKEFIERCKNFEGIIYFHNGGKFDIHFLLDDLDAQENVMLTNGRIARIKLGKCEIRDSYLLLPVPLSAYKKDEIDYDKFEEEVREQHIYEICNYLEGDCKYLFEILFAQFETYGQKLTLAASAFDYWHKNYNTKSKKPRTNQFFFETFKPFYYGGRVQCFQKGIINKKFEVYDINSAYPYAMTFEHPIGNEYSVTEELPDDLNACFIDLDCISKGAFTYREKNGLSFPTDNEVRNYLVTGWELQAALDLKKIKNIKINFCYKFSNTINFGGYVEEFFDKKSKLKDGDPAQYLLAKLYLNSLYGKFGQSSLDHKEYELIEKQHIVGYLNANYDYEGELEKLAIMSCPIPEHKHNFYNVATAASITGFVRAFLFSQLNNCKQPLYCDTDSIAGIGFKNIEIGKKLGEWEKEGDFSRAAIAGKKLYCFERVIPKKHEKYKISSKGAKLTAKEIIAIAEGEEIIYKNIAPTFKFGKNTEFITRRIKLT